MDNLSMKAMEDETWWGIIIHSIPPTAKWLPVIPSLYTMISSTNLVSTLLAHGMERGIIGKPISGSSNTALVIKTSDFCANPNCKAKKRSTHMTVTILSPFLLHPMSLSSCHLLSLVCYALWYDFRCGHLFFFVCYVYGLLCFSVVFYMTQVVT